MEFSAPASPDLPARYELRGFLGAGTMGHVWQVLDRERSALAALKVLTRPVDGTALSSDSLFLFKQEFWAMSTMAHPNLVGAHDYGHLADQTPYFVMDLVEGQDLSAVLAGGPVSEDHVMTWLPGLLQGLGHLHARGCVHGDLKPENIRLAHDHGVRLMDLGLLTPAGQSGQPIRGSLPYVAPEVIRQGALDGRSDLYSLGCVLYQALVGHPPFEAKETLAVLRAHLGDLPEPLSTLAPGVSPTLAAVVMRLLAKTPASRYSCVSDVMCALDLVGGLADVARLYGAPLVGRDEEITQSRGLLADLGSGSSVACWIAGRADAGKTRLLGAIQAEAQLNGCATLAARGMGEDAAPYAALRPWLHTLRESLLPLAGQSEAFERLGPLVARILPDLSVEPAPPLDGIQERARAHMAVAELATTAMPGPVSWLLDDADRLDAASAELLAALRRGGSGHRWAWFLSGVAATGAPAGMPVLALRALTDPEVRELAACLLGVETTDVPAEVPRALEAAEGWPGAIVALLAHWVESGVLCRVGGRWAIAVGATLGVSGGLAGMLEARVGALGADALTLARAAALIGETGELPLLAALVEERGDATPDDDAALQGRDAFFDAFAALESNGLLARDGIGFYFLRPAEAATLAAGWDAAWARRVHGRAAAWLEVQLPTGEGPMAAPIDRAIAIARHHLASDAPAKGVSWALAAARRSQLLHAQYLAHDLAVLTLQIDGLDLPTRVCLQAIRADALRFRGQLDEALAVYEGGLLADALSTACPELAAYTVSYGVVQMQKARYPEATAALISAIAKADADGDVVSAIRARTFLGRVAIYAGRQLAGRTHLGAAVRIARAHLGVQGSDALLSVALALYGYAVASAGQAHAEEGLALIGEAVERSNDIGDVLRVQEAQGHRGNLLLSMARYGEARDAFTVVRELCERLGSANELPMAELNLGTAWLEIGDVKCAAGPIARALAGVRAQGRRFPEGYLLALDGMVALAQGAQASAVVGIEKGLAVAVAIANPYLELNVRLHHVAALLHIGRIGPAGESLAAAQAIAAATGNREFDQKLRRMGIQLALIRGESPDDQPLAWDITAFLATAPISHRAHLHRWLAWSRWRCGDHAGAAAEAAAGLVHATSAGLLGVAGECEWLAGEAARGAGQAAMAAAAFRRAGSAGEALGHTLLAAVALAGLARVTGDRKVGSEARQRMGAILLQLDTADRAGFLSFPERAAAVAAAPAETTGVSLERVAMLANLAAAVAGSEDLTTVLNSALDALRELADAQRACVVLYDGFRESERIAIGYEDDAGFSTTLAEEVVWNRTPVVVEDVGVDARFVGSGSLRALEIRSAAGIPLIDGDQVVGVMLADSREVGSTWSEADIELATALGRVVAQAVGQARRRQAVTDRQQELEATLDFAAALVGRVDRPAIARAAIAEVCRLLATERAFLVLPEAHVALDFAGKTLPIGEAPLSHAVLDWAAAERSPAVVTEVARHEGEAAAGAAGQGPPLLTAPTLRTVIVIPALAPGEPGGRCLAVLYADGQRDAVLTPTDERIAARIGDLLGLALSRTVG